MYNHAPKNYLCPFCSVVKGIENENVETKQADIVYRDEYVTAFVSSRWWPNNPGHVVIVPNEHFENIYDLPESYSDKIHRLAKKIALALKQVYNCNGVSTRQHNEPAGNQDIFHYHLHVFPRYKNDRLYEGHSLKRLIPPKERLVYAKKLKDFLKKDKDHEISSGC